MKASKSLPQWLRRTLLVLACLIGASALTAGILLAIRSNTGTVNVYSVSDVKVDFRNSQSETSGPVTADRIQSVFVSQTQIVREIYVKEGDRVRSGDLLLAYDTTLTDIELQRQEIKVGQLQLELKQAEEQLAKVKTYVVGSPKEPEQPPILNPNSLEYYGLRARDGFGDDGLGNLFDIPSASPWLSGCGTCEEPYIVVWNAECNLTPDYLNKLYSYGNYVPSTTEDGKYDPVPATEVYVILEIRRGSSMGGAVEQAYPIRITAGPAVRILSALPAGYDPRDPFVDVPVDNNTYISSVEELEQLKKEAQEKVDSVQLNLKKAEYQYSVLEYEMNNGLVVSKIDGVVKTLADAEEVSGTKDPVLVVSGGGGYFVSGVLSETELPHMHVGDTVSAQSWESGQSFSAVITEIAEYPEDNSNKNYYHRSTGNSNASLYRFNAALEEGASVREGEELSITYTPDSENVRGIYLPSMFIRSENGISYIYVDNGNGILQRRNVSTGGVLYGTYTEIVSGLSREDRIAFPYGKDVKDGAKTRESSVSLLYGY